MWFLGGVRNDQKRRALEKHDFVGLANLRKFSQVIFENFYVRDQGVHDRGPGLELEKCKLGLTESKKGAEEIDELKFFRCDFRGSKFGIKCTIKEVLDLANFWIMTTETEERQV